MTNCIKYGSVRETMIKERKRVLEQMDDATLAASIRNYFFVNAAMPGENQLKNDAIRMTGYIDQKKQEPGFDMDRLYEKETRELVVDRFAETTIKSVQLKNPGRNSWMPLTEQPFSEGERLDSSTVQYVSEGEVNRTSEEAASVIFGSGAMAADIPQSFF